MREKGLEFELQTEKYWERKPDFLRLNPAGEVPVLVEPHGLVVAGVGHRAGEVGPPRAGAGELGGGRPVGAGGEREQEGWSFF